MLKSTKLKRGTFLDLQHLSETSIGHRIKNEHLCLSAARGLIGKVVRWRQHDMDGNAAFRSIAIVFEFKAMVVLGIYMIGVI